MNCRSQYLDPCSPKVKPGNLKQINTRAVPISQDQPRANTTLKWLKVTNLLMLPSNSGRLPAWRHFQDQCSSSRMTGWGEKNKSTKACTALWTDMKRKSKAIHTFNASTLHSGIGFYFHLKVPLQGKIQTERDSHSVQGRCLCRTSTFSG